MPITQDAPILITGAAGFVGKNLTARLAATGYSNLLCFDIHSPSGALEEYAAKAAFVFHLAGVNRPKDTAEFYTGNADLTTRLLAALRQSDNPAPVMLSSTTQAALGNDYGKSKQSAEQAVFSYGKQTAAPVYVYRFPGLFGKWSRPAYNSVVATFCHNIAHGQPIEVRDAAFSLPLVYIDDVVNSLVALLTLPPQPQGFAEVSPVYTTTLGTLADTIHGFAESRRSLAVPDMSGGLETKLYATYLSYLPETGFSYPLAANEDDRGSFTEFLRTPERGQVSVNVAKPGIVKGNHWHDTKNEKFLVVSGQAIIRFRRLSTSEVVEYTVNGQNPTVVDIPTGYTHNIENIGDTDLVTLMWASEPFDPERPDTYFEKV